MSRLMSRLFSTRLQLLALSLTLYVRLILATSSCYSFPNIPRTGSTYVVCSSATADSYSTCCGQGWQCLDRGLCYMKGLRDLYTSGCTDPTFDSPNCLNACNQNTPDKSVAIVARLCQAARTISGSQVYTCLQIGPNVVTGDLESACDERNFTYGPIRPWDGAVIHLDASAGVASVSHITDTQIDVSAHSQTQALESAAARTLPVGTTTSGIGPVSTDVESIPTSSWNSPSSSRMLTDTVHSFESTLPNLNVTKVSHAATTSSATFQLPQPSPRPPTPSKVSKSVSPTTIGAGVGAPIAGIAFLLLAFFLIRKQAEKKSKEPAKQEEPPRWSKPLLDSTTIHELNGRDTVQELDSKPIGAIEIGSNQIYEATGSEPRTAR